jgi:inorganic triphosphatase YgiF
MSTGIEVELKYLARSDAPLAFLATTERLGSARLGPPAVVDELDTYLDTPDLRMAAARWACRLRTRGDRTILSLKGPARHDPGDVAHRRPELEGPADAALSGHRASELPASAARDLLVELSGDEPLVERLALAQRRTERQAEGGLDGAGVARGVLTLDEVSVLHRERDVGRLRVVELELDLPSGGGERFVTEMAAAFSALPDLEPDPLSKLEHALAMLRAIEP